jgi:hypothetical protein
MEDAAGIALAVGGITAANELFFAPASGSGAKSFNFRIIPATLIFALLLDGLSQLSPRLATGVGVTALVTVLFTRVGNAPAPIENVDKILGFNKAGTVAKQQSVAGLLGG